MNPLISNLLFIGSLFAIFWFLLIRPQQQRAKQQQAMLEALTPGAEVVTIGGIFGTITEVGDRIKLRVADGCELEVARQAISQVLPAASGDEDFGEQEEALAAPDEGEQQQDA